MNRLPPSLDVLQVMASGAKGGGANHLLGLMPELQRLGVLCAVAVSTDGPLLESLGAAGIDHTALELMHSRLDPRAVVQFARLVRRRRPKIVHCHGTRAAYYAALAKAWWPRGTKLVYTVHGLSIRKERRKSGIATFELAERLICRASDFVISVSKADLEDLQRPGWISERRSGHIPNAVDSERVRPGDRAEARRRLGVPAGGMIVGTVARLTPQKAVHDLISAMADVPEALLLVVGDGELKAQLAAQATPLGPRVRFLGARADVPEILPALDLFVLSSHWEGEPIALLEAMAAGLPCVATATSGAVEIIGRSPVGVLVPIADVPALAGAIRTLLADSAQRDSLGRAARQAVLGRSHAAMAEKVARVYRKILAS